MGDKRFENPQTANLNNILKSCVLVRECLQDLHKKPGQGPEALKEQNEEQKKFKVGW